MEKIPEGLIVTPTKFEPTGNPLVMRPTYGSIGTQHVRFYTHETYSGSDSEKAQKEVKKQVDICEIQNDKFTKVPIRVNDLSRAQKAILAPLYERFKTQKDSNETQILDWDAVTDNEKIFLGQLGVMTVEQLNSFTGQDVYKLGPGAEELIARAKRHMKSKEEKNGPTNELALLRKEKEELAARLKRLEDSYMEKEIEKAKQAAPKVGRPKKVTEITEGTTNENI